MVRKIIDMSMLDKLKIDGEVANYLVQWDNTTANGLRSKSDVCLNNRRGTAAYSGTVERYS
ncbi:hypothetical protein PSA85_04600 [Limosilactobacillus reuteri]|uniref:hypothetical protein n=1 Tax=Limosilactobacillus reuteri TaxID=1598 RepID=UPI002362D979|nr:hypothetical protein [Limosilactobacillus reuteri]MDD1406659.1 hypothetical protein [Limosilactobacillus reuteri]